MIVMCIYDINIFRRYKYITLSFEIKSYDYAKNHKIYNIKLFRKGKIGVPGVQCMKDITRVLYFLLKIVKYIFSMPELELGPIEKKMTNYKTIYSIKNNQVLYLHNLKNILNEKHLDLLTLEANIQGKNNTLRIKFKYFNILDEKKDFLVEVFTSGKINVKGKYPDNDMIDRLNMIERYLSDV